MLCAYQMLDNNAFFYQKNLKNLFGAGDINKKLFEQVQQLTDIWIWTKETFVPILKGSTWYNGKQLDTNSSNYLINDFSSLIFGYAVMRQKRINQSKYLLILNYLTQSID